MITMYPYVPTIDTWEPSRGSGVYVKHHKH